ncbi:MAG: protein-export chaperone SecB, partial [Pseudomonadota bacterium]
IVTRAGFPPVILNPVNFEVIYQQDKQRADLNTVATGSLDEAKQTH